MLYHQRILRNLKDLFQYPLWKMKGEVAPDNHLFKVNRIITLSKTYGCTSFIETGTFYGQTVNAVKSKFDKVASVELFEPLYQLNKKAFQYDNNVTIYHGDSALRLPDMIRATSGRIIFWLDGHYSGKGTACGDVESPILSELETIKNCGETSHCILIDDARLFTGEDGYPTLAKTKESLFSINPQYKVSIDHDCIIAVPPH